MHTERGTIEGDLNLTESLELLGLVTGSVTVGLGLTLRLLGTVEHGVRLERGGSAVIYGVVGGDVLNLGGELQVSGIVKGTVFAIAGATTIAPDAVVGRVVRK